MKPQRVLLYLFPILLGLCFIVDPTIVYAEKKAPDHSSSGLDGEDDFEYFELSPLMLPILNKRGVAQQVSLIVSLEIDTDSLARVEKMQPKLADAYIQDLYGVLGAGHGMNDNIIDVKMLKERLALVTNHVMGPDAVHDVLLQVVQQRPM